MFLGTEQDTTGDEAETPEGDQGPHPVGGRGDEAGVDPARRTDFSAPERCLTVHRPAAETLDRTV